MQWSFVELAVHDQLPLLESQPVRYLHVGLWPSSQTKCDVSRFLQ